MIIVSVGVGVMHDAGRLQLGLNVNISPSLSISDLSCMFLGPCPEVLHVYELGHELSVAIRLLSKREQGTQNLKSSHRVPGNRNAKADVRFRSCKEELDSLLYGILSRLKQRAQQRRCGGVTLTSFIDVMSESLEPQIIRVPMDQSFDLQELIRLRILLQRWKTLRPGGGQRLPGCRAHESYTLSEHGLELLGIRNT